MLQQVTANAGLYAATSLVYVRGIHVFLVLSLSLGKWAKVTLILLTIRTVSSRPKGLASAARRALEDREHGRSGVMAAALCVARLVAGHSVVRLVRRSSRRSSRLVLDAHSPKYLLVFLALSKFSE